MAGDLRATGSLVKATTASALHLWLPALAGFDPAHPLRHLLRRADQMEDAAKGYLGGLADYFSGTGTPMPAAALTRDHLAHDAGGDVWLAADPAWVQPEMNGVRLLACGQLQLDQAEAEAFAQPLRPLFEEAGMQLELSTPDRWHLRMPADSSLPCFDAPEQALGDDLAQHLPQGPEGRRWRVLINEIQVTLHQHPLNQQRPARGLPPVNSLWLWGGGILPDAVRTELNAVISDDLLLQALASHAGLTAHTRRPEHLSELQAGGLLDLQDLPASEIAGSWWPGLQSALARQPTELHFASGEKWRYKPRHRFRVWRGAGH